MADALYIHIPFCIRKCIYCDFTSVPYDPTLAKGYAEALYTELRLKRDFAGELKTIYLGGGTPTVMPEDFFRSLFLCIKEVFAVSSSAEITVEANPGTISGREIETLLSVGVNRVSIGAQSLNDDELKTIGRIHNVADTYHAVELLIKAGVKNYSLDLMYAIPGQTSETWRETLVRTVEFGPSHVSAYELTPEENTRLFVLLKTGELELPQEELTLAMYADAIDFLSSQGYEHYEISNFARPGFRCLHNMNYWNRGEYVAAGTGAHSFVHGRRAKNTSDVKSYIDLLQAGLSPVVEISTVSPADELKECIFLGLRKREGINLKSSAIAETCVATSVGDLIDSGYLEIAGDQLRFTRKGVVLSNSILVTIFERMRI